MGSIRLSSRLHLLRHIAALLYRRPPGLSSSVRTGVSGLAQTGRGAGCESGSSRRSGRRSQAAALAIMILSSRYPGPHRLRSFRLKVSLSPVFTPTCSSNQNFYLKPQGQSNLGPCLPGSIIISLAPSASLAHPKASTKPVDNTRLHHCWQPQTATSETHGPIQASFPLAGPASISV
jgi:hypothetical protein